MTNKVYAEWIFMKKKKQSYTIQHVLKRYKQKYEIELGKVEKSVSDK